MLISESATDTVVVYMLMKRIMKPWTEWEAFELGLIDEDGKLIKKPKSSEERKAWTMLDRFIHKLKRLLQKFVGQSRLGSLLTVGFFLRDSYQLILDLDKEKLLQEEELISDLTHKKNEQFYKLFCGLPIPRKKRIFYLESDTKEMEFFVNKYRKRVDSYLKENDFDVLKEFDDE